MTRVTPPFDRLSLSDESWERRRVRDLAAIDRILPASLRALRETVVARAREHPAHSLILTGATARAKRTEISDLDYHLVGCKIEARDLSPELDLHVISREELEADVLEGDDFVQWSLRFGRVIFDDGALLDALRLMAERRPWPDVERKRRHVGTSLELALRVVDSGDEDGALLASADRAVAGGPCLSAGARGVPHDESRTSRPARGRGAHGSRERSGVLHLGRSFARGSSRGGAPGSRAARGTGAAAGVNRRDADTRDRLVVGQFGSLFGYELYSFKRGGGTVRKGR